MMDATSATSPEVDLSAEVGPPQLIGTSIELRPIAPSDFDFLYRISVCRENSFRWRFRGSLPDHNTFIKALGEGVLVQFLVIRRATSEPIGMVTAYGASHRDGHAYVAGISAPEFTGSGAVIDGLVTFIDYLFRIWPFRKLYLEVVEYNFHQFSSAVPLVAQIEGRFTDHTYYAGRYWDLITMAMYAEQWPNRGRLQSRPYADESEPMEFDEFCRFIASELCLEHDMFHHTRLIDDLELDSLEMVELAGCIEERTGASNFEMAGEAKTLGDIYLWYCTALNMPVDTDKFRDLK